MLRSRRHIVDLDYAVLHETGRRVHKDRTKMGDKNLVMRSIVASSDFEDLFASYDINNLNDEDELCEYVNKVSELKKEFRRIITQLKQAEGDEYPDKYPTYDETLHQLDDSFKKANLKWRDAKRNNGRKGPVLGEGDKESEMAKKKVHSQKKFLVQKVEWEFRNYKWETCTKIDEARSNISSIEKRLDEFYQICSSFESLYDELEMENLGYGEENEKFVTFLQEMIEQGKTRMQEIELAKEESEKEKLEMISQEKLEAEKARKELEEFEQTQRIKELMECAGNLHFEIKTRYDIFHEKCTRDFSKLSDQEVLDWKKREDSLHSELRELLDKISAFEMYIIPCGESALDLKKSVTSMRDEISVVLKDFLQKLGQVIIKRDISEKKLKNKASLDHEIPKFKGYDSTLDIYSFRAEFERVVEPNLQKCMLADCLKRKYLSGPAFNLVSKFEDIDEIWQKLIEVYGNSTLMFQNKVSSLEKFSHFEKLKDDEKIASNLNNLLNVMSDLVKLSEKFDLEAEL